MTDAEKIELLRAKLEETLSENDRLRALVTNLTEGANSHQTLQSIYRTSASESARIRAAQAALNVESAPLKPVEPPLELTAEPVIPLAELVAKRRARQNALENVPPGDPRWDEWIDKDRS